MTPTCYLTDVDYFHRFVVLLTQYEPSPARIYSCEGSPKRHPLKAPHLSHLHTFRTHTHLSHPTHLSHLDTSGTHIIRTLPSLLYTLHHPSHNTWDHRQQLLHLLYVCFKHSYSSLSNCCSTKLCVVILKSVLSQACVLPGIQVLVFQWFTDKF